MLEKFLMTTPKSVEPIDGGGFIWIFVLCLGYIVVNILVSYIQDNFEVHVPVLRVCLSAIPMFFLAYILFRGQQGLWLGFWLLLPVVILFVVDGVILQNDSGSLWWSLLGASIAALLAGLLDLLSENLASIPMSWGGLAVIVLAFFAFIASRSE